MRPVLLLIPLLLASCGTTTTMSSSGDKVKAGPGSKVVVTFFPDGTKKVEVVPISPLEAVIAGTVGGISNALLRKDP